MIDETEQVRLRYARRASIEADRYSPLRPDVLFALQERERALAKWLRTRAPVAPAMMRLIEIGCGTGSNLLQFLRLGLLAENLVGNELLEDRVQKARDYLPPKLALVQGDALKLDFAPQSFDVAFQSTVFTSILDADFRRELAARMWSLVRPGGGVLWYDFIYDNPRNPDVRGVSAKEVAQLFPGACIEQHRLTLAPPVSRAVTRLWPPLYHLGAGIPFLRTHLLAWIRKV